MSSIHLHLDAVGGVAGDMFVAAMSAVFPAAAEAAIANAARVAGVPCRIVAHGDGVLTGHRFDVQARDRDHHHHDHTPWHRIRTRIEAAGLADAVRDHALGIFAGLADAEATIHGIAAADVAFHEVGAVDSIADIIAAAGLIAAAGPATWSVGALPLGGGRVGTAHGALPVPAPATALLLQGFDWTDDGIEGERITPTGAAILKHLAPAGRRGLNARLARSGAGFGSRRLPGISNILRILVFDDMQAPAAGRHRELAVIAFEVDDQSAEDLATGLDRLRGLPGVHDVTQMAALGKKGRMAAHVQVLTRPDSLDATADACFRETTTIGLRTHLVQGRALPRAMRNVTVGDQIVRVKQVERAGGVTVKAESDDLRGATDQAHRSALRRAAELLSENVERE